MFKKIIIFLIIIILPVQTYAFDGLIKRVDLNRRAVMIKNNWYLLQENTNITRNNNISSLKSCRPLAKNNYQWAELVFDSSQKLKNLIVKYRIIEGIIKTINYKNKSLTVKTYKGPETRENFYNLFWSRNFVKNNKIKNLQIGEHIIIISGGKNILKIVK